MKDDFLYIEHIQECIRKIKEFTYSVHKSEFLENELIQDAVIRNIEVIGEASKNISDNFKKSYYEIPWKEMAGMRDKLIHDYMGVDNDVVWQTIINDIPVIEELFKSIKL